MKQKNLLTILAFSLALSLSACFGPPPTAPPPGGGSGGGGGIGPGKVLPPIPASADPTKPSTYMGHNLKDAKRFADRHNIPWRVVERNGEELMVTQDFIPSRMNFTVNFGVVTNVTTG